MAHILLVANWDWVLFHFRLPLARGLCQAGHRVTLVAPAGDYTDRLKSLGYTVADWPLERRSTNPAGELRAVVRLHALYVRLRPDVVHHFTIKPNLYGSLACWWMGAQRPRVINTFSGLGFLFWSSWRARVLRRLLLPLLRGALGQHCQWTVFQNRADRERFITDRLVWPDRARLIPGSGVDTTAFFPASKARRQRPVVLTAVRLLWDKGLADLVQAARILRRQRIDVEFWVAGGPDTGNPANIPDSVLYAWRASGLIRLLGHQEDIAGLLRQADIGLLASHHEGFSRFLLEAAATGLPLIATDIPGCRMLVRPGRNGTLVAPRAPAAIAAAVADLLANPGQMARYGCESRGIAEAEYSEERIVAQYLDLYQDVCRDEAASFCTI